jgi:hypothetical protein
MMVGTMSIAPGGLVSGWAADNTHHETSEQRNVRQTVTIIGDGSVLGQVLAQQHDTGSLASGFDAEHGYSYQLPNEFLDGVTPHTIQVRVYDGILASQTGPLS